MVEVGTEFQTEFALFDKGADVNTLSYEVWNRLGKPTLCESKTTLMTFSKETNHVEGYLDLPIYIGNTNVHHRFYVMKPGKANTPVILGQPWQRTYNGVPNWRREGINFEYDHARLFTPFLKDAKTLLLTQNLRMKKISQRQRNLQQLPQKKKI